MTVKLHNYSRRMLVLNLPHEAVCSEEKCYCSRQVVGVQQHEPVTGEKSVQAFKRRLASSLTLCAKGTDGDTVGDLPDGVLRAPDVRLAIKTGALRFNSTGLDAHDEALVKAKDKADTVPPPRGRKTTAVITDQSTVKE